MKKFWKYTRRVLRSILILMLISFTLESFVEQSIRMVKIQNFTKKAHFQEDISSEDVRYYKVDMGLDIPGYSISYDGQYLPGNTGDILVTTRTKIDRGILEYSMSFFVGGHAAICLGTYTDYEIDVYDDLTLESTGLDGHTHSIFFGKDDWIEMDNYQTVIALRPKGMNQEKREEILSVAVGQKGDPYNYTFTFDTENKSYCSDLITKVYKTIGCNVNKDGYWTTIHDILASNEVYITYYHYYKNGVRYVYYGE